MTDTTFETRFAAKYHVAPNGCWLWSAAKLPTGYGQIWFRGRRRNAHRAAYEHFVGPLPDGHEVHHRCANRSCVNPTHLLAVTHKTNMRESDTVMGRNARKTRCQRGHPLTGSNLYTARNGNRQCRQCRADYARQRRG